MSASRYPKYRDSGFDWIGEIPEHWRVSQIRYQARLESGHTPSRSNPDFWKNCYIPWFTLADVWQIRRNGQRIVHDTEEKISDLGLRHSSARLLPEGSVILSRTASVGFPAILGIPMAVSQDFAVWTCGHRLDNNFLWYALQAMRGELHRLMMGSTHQTIYMGEIEQFQTPLPPKDEQQTVVDFLDHETARIDALIEEQQRLIALFAEKRTALISHAIRDHGTGRETKLGHYAEVLQGYAFPSNKFQQEPGVRLLRGINIGLNGLRWNDVAYWPDESAAEYRRFSLRKDDIVFGMDRPWINGGTRVAWVTDNDLPALLLQRVARIRPRRGLTRRFLFLILSSSEFRESIESDLTGVSVPHISPDQIANFRLQLPDEMRQARICDAVDRELARLDSTTDEATGLIERLHERRSALIAAAVTGKIDVRQWHQANAPEIASESLPYRSPDQLA